MKDHRHTLLFHRPRTSGKVLFTFSVIHDLHLSSEIFCRQQYFEVLDSAMGELSKRTSQDNFNLAIQMEDLLVASANGDPHSIPESIQERYRCDIDIEKLFTQLQMLPEFTKRKKIYTVRTITDEVLSTAYPVEMIEEVQKLIRIYLTIPLTTATAERSFSALKLLKTYLRSSMSAERLNNSFLCFVYKERTDQIDVRRIAMDFVNFSERSFLGNI